MNKKMIEFIFKGTTRTKIFLTRYPF